LRSSLRSILQLASANYRSLPAGALIETIETGRRQLVFIEEGWAMKVADTDDGRRQVLRFLLPGDCVRCDVFCTDMAENTFIECITPCRIVGLDVDAARAQLSGHPAGQSSLTDELGALFGDAECLIVILGMFSAEERLAWMLLHLYRRAVQAGLSIDGRVPFPINQPQLASALGLSLVHTNKTLARLRRSGLVIWSNGTLHILDETRLAELCHSS
jgi:CRP-like cAMP-binding protein